MRTPDPDTPTWRDLADQLTAEQIAELEHLERNGHPGAGPQRPPRSSAANSSLPPAPGSPSTWPRRCVRTCRHRPERNERTPGHIGTGACSRACSSSRNTPSATPG